MSTMSRAVALGCAASLMAVACTKVPYTGRKQFNLVPDGMMNSIGASTYQEMLSAVSVDQKSGNAKTLTQVGNRISKQANKPEYEWSYAMIEDAALNAWALPGGYIGFYTGILPVLQSEAGMAFVMGHEVGHATARHGSERMSQQLGLMGGLTVLDIFITGSGKLSEEQRGMVMAAAGLGAQYGVMLPFSRSHEKEADVIGMMYMAGAGYPPAESIEVWERMEALTGAGPAAFMSTHPSFDARKDNQREWLPEAKKRFKRNETSAETRASIW